MRRRRRTYVLWKRILVKFLVLFVSIGIVVVYFHTGVFTIRNYSIHGVPEAYLSDLEKGIQNLSEQKLYKVLPGNRVVSYHDGDIRALIMDTLPNTSTLSIRPSGLHTLSITLRSYTPLFSIDDRYAISREGVIYKEIVPMQDYVRLRIASTTYVTTDMLASISTLSGNISSVLFPVKFIAVDEYNDVRFYDATKKMFVIVAASNNGEKTWSNILSAIDTDPLKKKLEAQSEHLEYIDARFGNKVFYKFTNGSVPAIIPPHDKDTAGTTTPVN